MGLLQGQVAGGWSDGSLPSSLRLGPVLGGKRGGPGMAWMLCCPHTRDDLQPRFSHLLGGAFPSLGLLGT